MRLARIRIENFRSIRSIDFTPGSLCGLCSHAPKQVGLDLDPDTSDVRISFRPFDPLNFYKSLSLVLCEGDQEFDAEDVGAGHQSSSS